MSLKYQSSLRRTFFVAIILLGLVAGSMLIKRTYYLASLALTPSSVGDVDVRLDDASGGLTKVTIYFRTGTNDENTEAISTTSFRLNVSSDNMRELSVVDQDGNDASTLVSEKELESTGQWKFPVNSVKKEDKIIADFAAVDESLEGYSSSEYKPLASFYLKGVGFRDSLQIQFDKDTSVMYSKRRPVTDIWEE